MAIEMTEGGGYVITGEADIRLYQIIALRTALKTEVRTGMKFSHRGSPFQTLKNLGIIPNEIRTKKKGLEIVEAYLENVKKARERNANNNNNHESANSVNPENNGE